MSETTRRTAEEIAADIKTCLICDEDGGRIGTISMRRDQVPAAFSYQGRIYLQAYKREYFPLEVRPLADSEVKLWPNVEETQ